MAIPVHNKNIAKGKTHNEFATGLNVKPIKKYIHKPPNREIEKV